MKTKKFGKLLVKRMTTMVLVCAIATTSSSVVWGMETEPVQEPVVSCEDNYPNLQDNYQEGSPLCEKLQDDYNNDTTQLSPQVERELNEAGVFDSAIEELDDETIEELENSINTAVTISYVSVDEKTGEMKEMSNDEVDNFIETQAETGDYRDDPQVSVAAYNEGTASEIDSTRVMKQTIYACQNSKGAAVQVTATASWLTEAYYKGIDVFGVSLKYGDLNKSSSFSCTHKANFVHMNYTTLKLETTQKQTSPSSYVLEDSGIAYRVNLFGDRPSMDKYDQYCQETIIVKFSCKPHGNEKSVQLTSHYYHAESNKVYTPAVNIGTGGISISISGGSSVSYTEMDRNPQLSFTVK